VVAVSTRTIEAAFIAVIALAVLLGGRSLLVEIALFGVPAAVLLAILGVAQTLAMRRNFAAGGPLAGVRATRDVAFIAATIAAVAFVLAPARWSIGTCIVALEIALVLELMARFTPSPPPAA
jgi:hypothetical protein